MATVTLGSDERAWRRFSPAQRIGRFVVYLALVAAVVASLRTIEVIPEFLYDAPEQVADLFGRMWPIAWEHYPQGVHDALLETLHLASLGTLLALLLATPVGILAANRLVPSRRDATHPASASAACQLLSLHPFPFLC